MKKRILAACAAAALAASLCACGDQTAVPESTAGAQAAAVEGEMTEVFAEAEEGFRVNAAQNAFVRVGNAEDGIAALETCLARLHPAAGDFHATFGEVTLAMSLAYEEDGGVTLAVTGAEVGTHQMTFDVPYQTHFATGGVTLFAVGDRTVLTYIDPARADNYVFDGRGITALRFSAETDGTDCSAPVVQLTARDGALGFVAWPKKYADGIARFDYFCGTDEILKVEGSADLADDRFVFSTERLYSFADLNADGALDYVYFCNTSEDAASLAAKMAENAKQYAPFTAEAFADADFAACVTVQ